MTEKSTYEELEQKIKELEKQVAGKESLQADKESQTTSAAPVEDTESKTPKRILVIDDSEIDRMILEEILKQAGYEVVLASDGEEGLERFYENPTDLVITDMVMPKKMGIDVISELKEKYPDLKIISISAGGDFGPELELDMARCFDAITITKPFNPKEILKVVNKLITIGQAKSKESEQKDIPKNEKTLKIEKEFIDKEINRSKHYSFKFGLLAVQVSQSVPRGLSKLLPGRIISFHLLDNNLRLDDSIIKPSYRRYYVILPRTDKNGVKKVEKKIFKLAKKHKWGDIFISAAVYPDDGNTSYELLNQIS